LEKLTLTDFISIVYLFGGDCQANLSGDVPGVFMRSGELCRVFPFAVQPAATFVELALKSVAVGGVSVACGLFHIFILAVF
jgi:hypothetical protein